MPAWGYSKLKAEVEMTACLSGTCAYWRALSRYASARVAYWNGPAVKRGSCRVCPSANGMVTPSGASVRKPCIGYVAKLGLPCSPSVITGDPVASKRSMVSRMLSSSMTSYSDAAIPPASTSRAAWIRRGGRGMLPIGSVVIGMHYLPEALNDFSSPVRASVRTAHERRSWSDSAPFEQPVDIL